jgi:hypothetical protein
MVQEQFTAKEFRQFLSRIADESMTVADWNRFTLRTVSDAELDAMRKRLIQSALSEGQCSARPVSSGLKATAISMLEEWTD